MRYGICAGLEMAPAVKAAGFDYIELAGAGGLKPLARQDSSPEVHRQLQKVGISCESMNLLFSGGLKVTGPEADEKKLAFYIQTVAQRAERVGVETIVFGGGGARRVPDGFARDKAKEQVL